MMARDHLYARIREEDKLIREHFSKIKEGDYSYEIRRLLEKAIKIEQKEKKILKEMENQMEQDSK